MPRVAALLRAAGAAAAAQVQPYGTNDAGGFRNVLPPGQAGVDNAAELAANQATARCRRTGPTSSRSTTG